MTSIHDLVNQPSKAKAPESPKELPLGPNGEPVMPSKTLPGEGMPAATLVKERRPGFNPLSGKRCAVKRCREDVAFAWRMGVMTRGQDDIHGLFEQPELRNDTGILATIEARMDQIREGKAGPIGVIPARQVEEPEFTYLCLRHSYEFQEAVAAKAEAERLAARGKAFHEMNWTGASVEIDSTGLGFTLTDGDGSTVHLDMRFMPEVQAYLTGKQFRPQALSPEEIKDFQQRIADQQKGLELQAQVNNQQAIIKGLMAK